MDTGLFVQSEIAPLKKVCLHRPGEELLNLIPSQLDELLFDDIPYFEGAQQEHDHFAKLLKNEGVEVCYLEDLVAEALDAAASRAEFTQQWLDEAGLQDLDMRRAVTEYMDAIPTTRGFIDKTIAGIRKSELSLPKSSSVMLSDLVNANQDTEPRLLIEPMPNVYFTRDPFAVIGQGVSVNRMFSATRNRETIFGRYIFRDHPIYNQAPLWYQPDAAFHIEGGDILNLNAHTLAIGISQRTQAAAIDQLAQRLFWDLTKPSNIDTIYAFNIPVSRAFMHLDTVFTQIDVNMFTIHPALVGLMQVFKLTRGAVFGDITIVELNDKLERILEQALDISPVTLIPCGGSDPVAAAREQWNDGSNTLCVAPGKICVYQRNTVTNELLYKNGLELLVLPSAELSRGRGGPRCMSMPLQRG